MSGNDHDTLSLLIHGFRIDIECADGNAMAAIAENFGEMAGAGDDAHLLLRVEREENDAGFVIVRQGQEAIFAADLSDLIYELEGIITIELQLFRRDLLFVHAAVLERDGRVVMLVADSGGGKSTTSWALLHHGFAYLSDELAGIDLRSQRVYAYPHAVCLKRDPPEPFPLPARTLRLGRTMHVPPALLPARVTWGPYPLAAVFFVNFISADAVPEIKPIGAAEASARLYRNVLNALAHPEAGLDATIDMVRSKPRFLLNSGKLADTCELVVKTLDAL